MGIGTYTVTAIAFDSLGTVNSSTPVTFNVVATAPPTSGLMLWLKADAITGVNNGDGARHLAGQQRVGE